MKLLVLGGTRFLGRHLVEAALARAMDVTIFTRGRSAVPWLDRVTSLVGDRGPFDATDRFGYWVARFVHPQLLGDRPPRAVVPEPPERPLQFIDARDLAAWMLDVLERDVAGTFNAASPAWQWRMNDFVKALIAASPAAPRPAWIDEPRLVAAGVEPWTGLPMWLPASDADSAGLHDDELRACAARRPRRPAARGDDRGHRRLARAARQRERVEACATRRRQAQARVALIFALAPRRPMIGRIGRHCPERFARRVSHPTRLQLPAAGRT
jgi:nucleoside-diphosphate-sugar epimerase